MSSLITLLPVIVIAFTLIMVPFFLRRVVEPNEAHIVQGRKGTRAFGKAQPDGNAYYSWPSWLPIIGVQTVTLPLSVFKVALVDYAAYDKDKVPFLVDITAFFRIDEIAQAAERVLSTEELDAQLRAILQGAARTILAKSDIETIMVERSQYGELFTKEVDGQLKEWGVRTVKNIELMDIRDTGDTKVIANIMARKESDIERHSRSTVAENHRQAKIAEIEAQREQDLASQDALQKVGQRTAEQEKAVGVARQKSQQEIRIEEQVTAEKTMAVRRVENVRAAEIAKDVQIQAADAVLETRTREATAVRVNGESAAEARRLMELAPISAQVTLAKEIGSNEGYQKYLVNIRSVEREQVVGVAQAEALKAADIRVITNAGTPVQGIEKIMDLFSSKGGTEIGAMAEAFAQSDLGEQILKRLGVDRSGTNGAAHK